VQQGVGTLTLLHPGVGSKDYDRRTDHNGQSLEIPKVSLCNLRRLRASIRAFSESPASFRALARSTRRLPK